MRCGQPQRPEAGPHPLAALAHRLVGQPDHREGDGPRRHQHLHVHRQDIDALERHRPNRRLHVPLPFCTGNN